MDSFETLYRFAQNYLPGGVAASARINAAIGHPFYITHGDGPYVFGVDGRAYIDMSTSHGASLLGHNHPKIKAAVQNALDLGILCAYETEYNSALAKRLTEIIPCAELVRFAGSGTETVMHALRLTRTATGRNKFIKFEGHFHGYWDGINFSQTPPLDQAGPPEAPIPYPQSAGIPNSEKDMVIIVPFNDPAALRAAFEKHGSEVAALILEPINYDSGCIIPEDGFIPLCQDLCRQYGSILFFDEVLTAFRFALGGAQEYFGVTPDICVLGKAFGGSMPISAIAGKRELMQYMKPLGQSEHSGTFQAHLTAVLAATAAVQEYSEPGFYERLNTTSDNFFRQFHEIIARSGVPVQLQHIGPRFALYFGVKEKVLNYRQSAKQNHAMLLKFIEGAFQRGVYLHVSPHHGFSSAHGKTEMDLTLEAFEGALSDVQDAFPEKSRAQELGELARP